MGSKDMKVEVAVLETKFDTIVEKIDDIKTDVGKVHKQVMKTNGRVSSLEKYRNVGAGVLLAFGFIMGYPKVIALFLSLLP